MKSYICHKKVQAAKITAIVDHHKRDKENVAGAATKERTLELEGSDPVIVTKDWIEKRGAKVGCYFVQYEDGYQTCSPAERFDADYSEEQTVPETRAQKRDRERASE